MAAIAPERPGRATQSAARVILAGGHEGGAAAGAVHPGRPLAEAVRAGLAASSEPVCVVPMTLGRDPGLIADCARALRWLSREEEPGRLVLAPPFATVDHLTAWLRTAALKAVREAPDTSAVLVTAPAAGPFEDADLFRVARLVRQYGHHRWVEVAFDGGDPDLAEGAERCRRLGAGHVSLVRAAFAPPAELPSGVLDTGPLLSDAAIAQVVRARSQEALHRLAHGQDGVAEGLDAEHGHGYAHSHGPGGDHGHHHGHADPDAHDTDPHHTHAHGEGHRHARGQGHGHPHGHSPH
ncbi:cobalamin biosynthesis protein CbiX [Streptomyces sp. NBC_00193]|uniref:sirohydrochlorin chelatase n=1 Tax=Streptomyces sp. NBC_00193 TaxID=2975675 RepID=UPI0022526736|nr:cobalamin biosynthesis protein CbiX [Streptomyces sp. NBC_00193]MCX5300985.1 cobalamin biosynthesis protein CbiX [Streptomyces sp. NBC_00193]